MDSTNQLRNFFDFLGTPVGLLAVFFFLICLIVPLIVPKTKWLLLVVVVWAASLGSHSDNPKEKNVLLAFPLEQIRDQGRAITIGCLTALLLPALITKPSWRTRSVAPAAIMFLLFELMFTGRALMAGDATRSIPAIVIFSMTFLVFGVGISKSLQSVEDVERVIKMIVAVLVTFIVGSLYQIAINRAPVMSHGRMMGTTGNSQHAAIAIALGILPTCYLITSPSSTRKSRLFAGTFISVLIIFLLWTGSRTGFLMTLVGIAVMYRTRISTLALLVLVAAISFGTVWAFFGNAEVVNSHIVSTENTRGGVWSSLISDFIAHPIFGDLSDTGTFGVRENSYLATAAVFGLVGFFPLLFTVALALRNCLKLLSMRAALGKHAAMADLVAGATAAIFVAGFFEGILLGLITLPVYILYIYFALCSALIDIARQNVWASAYMPSEQSSYIDPAYGVYYQ